MTESRLRAFMVTLLLIELTGAGVELLLMHHYEDSWQLVPLVLIGLSIVVLIWHLWDRSAMSVRVLQLTMLLCLVAGAIGVLLHYQSNVEFQTEMDQSLTGWPLFITALQAKVPPALAPGLMAQLGLLGLVYAYRHPATSRKLQE